MGWVPFLMVWENRVRWKINLDSGDWLTVWGCSLIVLTINSKARSPGVSGPFLWCDVSAGNVSCQCFHPSASLITQSFFFKLTGSMPPYFVSAARWATSNLKVLRNLNRVIRWLLYISLPIYSMPCFATIGTLLKIPFKYSDIPGDPLWLFPRDSARYLTETLLFCGKFH